jgi:hypothetical protein
MKNRLLSWAFLSACLASVFACGCSSWIDWESIYDEIDGKPVVDLMPVADESYRFDPQILSTGVPAEEFLTPVPLDWKPTPDAQTELVRPSDHTLYTIASRVLQEKGEQSSLGGDVFLLLV